MPGVLRELLSWYVRWAFCKSPRLGFAGQWRAFEIIRQTFQGGSWIQRFRACSNPLLSRPPPEDPYGYDDYYGYEAPSKGKGKSKGKSEPKGKGKGKSSKGYGYDDDWYGYGSSKGSSGKGKGKKGGKSKDWGW
jgi:hypothetical protein